MLLAQYRLCATIGQPVCFTTASIPFGKMDGIAVQFFTPLLVPLKYHHESILAQENSKSVRKAIITECIYTLMIQKGCLIGQTMYNHTYVPIHGHHQNIIRKCMVKVEFLQLCIVLSCAYHMNKCTSLYHT